MEVVELTDIREIGPKKVRTAKVKDATGECNLDLWEDNVNIAQVGDTLKGYNLFFKEREWTNPETGVKQTFRNITTGKYGKVVKVES